MLRGLVLVLILAMPLSANAFSWASALTFVKTLKDEASAWAVSVKQTALGASQQNDSKVRSNSMLATAIGAIEMADRVGQAIVNFDSKVGQPERLLCQAQTEGKLRNAAQGQRDLDASHLMQHFASSRTGSQSQAYIEAIEQHSNLYCSIAEARAGACKLTANGMQSWDSDYSGFSSQATLSPEGELAGIAYTTMLTDTRASVDVDCKSLSCQSGRTNRVRRSALASMSANSFIGQIVDRRILTLTGQ